MDVIGETLPTIWQVSVFSRIEVKTLPHTDTSLLAVSHRVPSAEESNVEDTQTKKRTNKPDPTVVWSPHKSYWIICTATNNPVLLLLFHFSPLLLITIPLKVIICTWCVKNIQIICPGKTVLNEAVSRPVLTWRDMSLITLVSHSCNTSIWRPFGIFTVLGWFFGSCFLWGVTHWMGGVARDM